MNTITAILFFAILAITAASPGLRGAIDGPAIISGPSGTVRRPGNLLLGQGLALEGRLLGGPIGGVETRILPGEILAGPGLGREILIAPVLEGRLLAGPGLRGLGEGRIGLRGSGIEGQYIPDLNAKLYDDGTYKPRLYGP
ncbi:uncharacterized protein LOC115890315 [Sitophilus oryzae]|uniref:Uncharacterized protein LOC115890315 n=1 Tax=Sitophilus oryzae TaxID=7048 RepID=A0A6J2YSY3_SITOR|nr:uncharacterized protein LOC115890315 [Sitophilus oryzae]